MLALVLAVGSELTFGRLRTPKGCVLIVNQSDAAMDDLIVSYGGTDVAVKRLGQGESINVWFTAGEPRSAQPGLSTIGEPAERLHRSGLRPVAE